MKHEDSVRLATRRQFVLNEFIQNSHNGVSKQKTFEQNYQTSRELLKEKWIGEDVNTDGEKQNRNDTLRRGSITYDKLR